jgi:hypothetical protein
MGLTGVRTAFIASAYHCSESPRPGRLPQEAAPRKKQNKLRKTSGFPYGVVIFLNNPLWLHGLIVFCGCFKNKEIKERS